MSKTTTEAFLEAASRMDPKEAAAHLIRANGPQQGWLDTFAEQLDRQRNADALARILAAWDLNQSDAARIFGVSRQAISKWLDAGVPAERATAIADLGAATDLLLRHLQRDRVPGVVRRRASRLGDQSLLELLLQQEFRSVLEACRAMFAFADA